MFGMGTGGSLRLLSPEIVFSFLSFRLFDSAFSSRLRPSPCSSLALPVLRFTLAHFALCSCTPALRFSFHALFHTLKTAQGSAPASFALSPFRSRFQVSFALRLLPLTRVLQTIFRTLLLDQALDRLVSSSSIHYCTSTYDLSTSSSLRGLTHF